MEDSYNTFTYFISSINRVSGTECHDCEIEIGPVSENYDSYYCECISFNMEISTILQSINAWDTYYLVADRLAENGYNTRAAGTTSLQSDQFILGSITVEPANHSYLRSDTRTKFIIKNLRQKRRIRFRLYGSNLQPENGVYTQPDTDWSCVLLLTPIK